MAIINKTQNYAGEDAGRSVGDELTWVLMYVYMKVMLGIFLYSYP
jgi:hypothetical protein